MSQDDPYNNTSDLSIHSQEDAGGMGDIIDNESSVFFADDERESGTVIVLQPRRGNFCTRCRRPLETRARICRACYNNFNSKERRRWMPYRPTKRLRKRRTRTFCRERSAPDRSSNPQGISLNFDNLTIDTRMIPGTLQSRTSLSSSESNNEFYRERAVEWQTRRSFRVRQTYRQKQSRKPDLIDDGYDGDA